MKQLTTRQVREARTPKQAFLAGLSYNLPEIQEDYNRLIGEAGEAGRGQMAPSVMYHHELAAYGIPSTVNGLIEPSAEIEGNLRVARLFYKAHGHILMREDMVEWYEDRTPSGWAEGRAIKQASEPRSAHTVIDDLEARKHLGSKQAAWLRRAVDGTKVRKHNGESPAECIERIYTARQRRISTADYELLLTAV